MPERRPALVHNLGLALRIKILRHLAYDAYDFPLPRLQQRRVLLDKIQQILLWLAWVVRGFRACVVFLGRLGGYGPPQLVHLLLHKHLALFLARAFCRRRNGRWTSRAVHAVVHQGMTRIENLFYRVHAVALLALGDVMFGE